MGTPTQQLLIDAIIEARRNIFDSLSDIFRRDVACGMFYVDHSVINDAIGYTAEPIEREAL